MNRTTVTMVAMVAVMILGLLSWWYKDSPKAEEQLPGEMELIARVPGVEAVYHLRYKDRHYLVTSSGGIMVLPQWVEGSAKVRPPLEQLGPRRHGPEPRKETM